MSAFVNNFNQSDGKLSDLVIKGSSLKACSFEQTISLLLDLGQEFFAGSKKILKKSTGDREEDILIAMLQISDLLNHSILAEHPGGPWGKATFPYSATVAHEPSGEPYIDFPWYDSPHFESTGCYDGGSGPDLVGEERHHLHIYHKLWNNDIHAQFFNSRTLYKLASAHALPSTAYALYGGIALKDVMQYESF